MVLKSVFALTLLLTWLVPPQEFETLTKIKEIETEFDFIRVDNFGKIYGVRNDEVFMYDYNGNFLSRNSNKLLGQINDLDVSNGLEISVFFKDQIQVVFLDNQLALKGRQISFDLLELEQVSEICTSHGNGIWIYDQIRMELIRIDKNNNHVATSGNLRQILGYSPEPIYMREVNNWVYLNDPEKGILVFDIYGSYYKTIPIYGIEEFQVKEQKVIFYKKPYLVKFDMQNLEFDTSMSISNEMDQVLVTKNQLNTLNNKHLTLYRYTP